MSRHQNKLRELLDDVQDLSSPRHGTLTEDEINALIVAIDAFNKLAFVGEES